MTERDHQGDALDGEEIYRFTPGPETGQWDDQALEYSVRAVSDACSGLVVYGRYQRGWIANPSLRPVVRELLERLNVMPQKPVASS